MPSKSPIRGSHETKLLFDKSIESLILAIELFNRPSPTARTHAVLMLLDHAVEMLMKAALLTRDPKTGIMDPDQPRNTIGMKAALNRARSSSTGVRFLTPEQHGLLWSLNLLRGGAQHHLNDPSEEQLYALLQSTVTLIRDILQNIFSVRLDDLLPQRVLPLSTMPLRSIEMLYEDKAAEIRKVVLSGPRQRHRAREMARPLVVLERGLAGLDGQPTARELDEMVQRLADGSPWQHEFPETSTLDTIMESGGATITLRMVKRGGIPVQGVDPADATDDLPVVTRDVSDFERFPHSTTDLVKKLGKTQHQVIALSRSLGLYDDPKLHKVIVIKSQTYKQFSNRSFEILREKCDGMSAADLKTICDEHGPGRKRRAQVTT